MHRLLLVSLTVS